MPDNDSTSTNEEAGIALVVTQPFHGYQRGDAITDPEKVAEILAGEWADHVVKRAA